MLGSTGEMDLTFVGKHNGREFFDEPGLSVEDSYHTFYDTLDGHWAWWVRIEGQMVRHRAGQEGRVRRRGARRSPRSRRNGASPTPSICCTCGCGEAEQAGRRRRAATDPAASSIVPGPAPVAQLDRASGFEPEGRGFESLPARQWIALHVESVAGGVSRLHRPILLDGVATRAAGRGTDHEASSLARRAACLGAPTFS